MRKFSLLELVVVAACSSRTAEPIAPAFPLDRYEQAQASKHTEQLLRTAQAGKGSAGLDAGVDGGMATGTTAEK